MASSGDDELLFLIYEHLKVSGYQKAAKVLEKHVSQVEAADSSSTLHDIYTDWMKTCSGARHAKQETEVDSTTLKKSVKTEPVTSREGEEEPEVELTDDGLDSKPLLDLKLDAAEALSAERLCVGTDEETVSQRFQDPPAETKTTNGDGADEKDEEAKPEAESPRADASVEETNSTKSFSSDSCGPDLELNQVDSGRAASDQTEDQLQTPDAAEASSSDGETSQEQTKDDKELKQDPESASEVTGEAAASEHTPVSQTETTPPCTQTVSGASLEDNGSAAQVEYGNWEFEEASEATPTTHDMAGEETNEQLEGSEAPPPADPESDIKSEKAKEEDEREEEEEEKGKMMDDDLVTPTQRPEEQAVTSTTTEERGGPAPADGAKRTAAADPDASITLNIREEERETSQLLPEEAAESCSDPKAPRKRKRSRKSAEVPSADTPSVLSTEPAGDAPLTAKKRREEEEQHQEEEEEDVSQDVPRERKKAKKRKPKRNEVEEEVETPAVEKKKRKKKVRDCEVEAAASPLGKREKKGKKERRREEEEVQSDGRPAGVSRGKEENLDSTDGGVPQLPSTKKKHRLRKKLSLSKRIRLKKEEKRRRKNFFVGQTNTREETKRKKKKRNQEAAEAPPQPDYEDQTPQKKKAKNCEQENTSKENQTPKARKEKKKKQELERGEEGDTVSAQNTEVLFPHSGEGKKKKKKLKDGKGDQTDEICTTANQDAPAKKKKKQRLKEMLEEMERAPESHTPPAAAKRKKSSKKV